MLILIKNSKNDMIETSIKKEFDYFFRLKETNCNILVEYKKTKNDIIKKLYTNKYSLDVYNTFINNRENIGVIKNILYPVFESLLEKLNTMKKSHFFIDDLYFYGVDSVVICVDYFEF